jgi:signal transduction histidine kinase
VLDNGAGFDVVCRSFGAPAPARPNDFPGTGVGLATVARIVQRHHGRVWAESSPGAGASFYFTLNESPES